MKISLSRLVSVLFLGLLVHQVQAQEIYINIPSGPSLVGDYDPAFGRIEIVQQGTNLVVTAYLKPGADFKGWGTAGFANRCNNAQQQCVIPVSVLKAATSQPRIKAIFASGTAYLLMHGMNSNPGTWYNLIINRFGGCGIVEKGKVVVAQSLGGGQRCFALQAGVANGWSNGDGMTYQQLGAEVTNVLGNIQTSYPGIGSFVLVAHSRGGLAARAAFATNAASMQKVRGLLTVATPNLGSAFGRIPEWLKANPRPTRKSCVGTNAYGERESVYCTAPGTSGMASEYDRDRAWRLADFVQGPIGRTPLNSPTVGYLSPESPVLVDLNKNRLPSGRKYAYIASDGLDLGKLLGLNGQSIISFNIFGEGLGVFAPPLPLSAQQYLIRGKYNQNKTYANYRGDGIVAVDSQKALPAPSLTASRTLWKTFHVDEPSISLGYDAIIALLPTL